MHPCAPASMLDGDSTITSSGSGGAPGSPGLRRLEEVVDETTLMLAPAPEGEPPPLCMDGRVSEPVTSEEEGLRSPSGWKSTVELFENMVVRSLVVLGVLTLLSDEELEAPAVELQMRS